MPDGPNLGIFSAYEDGKHRRYSLLFAVNGGAFAIVQFMAKPAPDGKWTLGHLNLHALSWGLCLFTIAMVGDIYAFGNKMRKIQQRDPALPELFGLQGKSVLLFIGALICLGWILAGIC